jgi:hypothetical protein
MGFGLVIKRIELLHFASACDYTLQFAITYTHTSVHTHVSFLKVLSLWNIAFVSGEFLSDTAIKHVISSEDNWVHEAFVKSILKLRIILC